MSFETRNLLEKAILSFDALRRRQYGNVSLTGDQRKAQLQDAQRVAQSSIEQRLARTTAMQRAISEAAKSP